MSNEFINFYLKDKKEELKNKWKIISFLENETEKSENNVYNNINNRDKNSPFSNYEENLTKKKFLKYLSNPKILKILLIPFLILYILIIIAPSNVLTQSLFVYTLILFSLLIIKFKPFDKEYVKLFVILIALIISLRYFYWRATETLNFDTLLNALGSLSLFIAEVYSLSIFLLGAFISLRLLDRKHIPLSKFKEEDLPTVDIYIPTYNEPIEIIKTTAIAASIMNYPKDKFNVYVLDDGGTTQKLNDPDLKKREENKKRAEALKKMCSEIGENVHYLTREKNEHAKAGNINSAMKKTNGDLILILDCDHVPTQDFLARTVGFFIDNPKLFLVQTPHKFYNPDPIEKNLRIFRQVPNESEMFYNFIQKGLDFWEASFFCGSGAILRRKYLEQVGGIAGDTITEDAETALELHSLGYDSYYYPRGMLYGLQPETFSAFVIQRSRWAQGMIQIFFLKKPFLRKGLKWHQKLGYLNANFFWFFSIARIIFLLAPLLFLFFGVKIYNATLIEVLAYAIPHFIGSLIVSYYLYAKYRWPFFSEVYESIQSVFLLPAVISVLKNLHAPTFIVTPKGEEIDEEFVSPFYKPLYLIFNLIFMSFIFGIYKFIFYPDYRGSIVILLFWELFNFIFLALGVIVSHEKPEKRKAHRVPGNDESIIFVKDRTFNGIVKDLSLTGIWISIEDDLTPYLKYIRDSELKFLIKDVRGIIFHLKGKVVNANAHNIRMEFMFNSIEEEKKIVELVYAPSVRWEYFSNEEKAETPMESLSFLIKLTLKDFMKAYKAVTKEFLYDLYDKMLKIILKIKNKYAFKKE